MGPVGQPINVVGVLLRKTNERMALPSIKSCVIKITSDSQNPIVSGISIKEDTPSGLFYSINNTSVIIKSSGNGLFTGIDASESKIRLENSIIEIPGPAPPNTFLRANDFQLNNNIFKIT